MKSDAPMNQNTEHAEYQDIRQNTPEYGRRRIYGGVLLATVLVSCAVFWYAPVSAQIPTVTPWPAVVATATAAAQRMTEAQQQQHTAAQLQAQADAAKAQADAAYSQAQTAASEARSALAAQQVAAASEAIGRAETLIESGNAQVAQIAGIVTQQRGMIDQNATLIMSLTVELQNARTERSTAIASYNAVAAQRKQDMAQQQTGSLLGNIVTMFVFVSLCALLVFLGVVIFRMKRNGVTVTTATAQIIEPDEQEDIDNGNPTTDDDDESRSK